MRPGSDWTSQRTSLFMSAQRVAEFARGTTHSWWATNQERNLVIMQHDRLNRSLRHQQFPPLLRESTYSQDSYADTCPGELTFCSLFKDKSRQSISGPAFLETSSESKSSLTGNSHFLAVPLCTVNAAPRVLTCDICQRLPHLLRR